MQGDKLQLFIILKKNCLSWCVLLRVFGGVGACDVVSCAIDDDDLVVGGNCMCPSLQLLLPMVGFEMASIFLFLAAYVQLPLVLLALLSRLLQCALGQAGFPPLALRRHCSCCFRRCRSSASCSCLPVQPFAMCARPGGVPALGFEATLLLLFLQVSLVCLVFLSSNAAFCVVRSARRGSRPWL